MFPGTFFFLFSATAANLQVVVVVFCRCDKHRLQFRAARINTVCYNDMLHVFIFICDHVIVSNKSMMAQMGCFGFVGVTDNSHLVKILSINCPHVVLRSQTNSENTELIFR
jgi:hypothetical protein